MCTSPWLYRKKTGEAQSGMRQDIELTVFFNIEAALKEGFPVYESGNGVILTGDVPLRY